MIYKIEISAQDSNKAVLNIGFGEPATNSEIVKEATEKSLSIKEELHGKLVLLNGPASLPVAVAIAHQFGHVAAAIGVYDPKLAGYVIAVSHNPAYTVGQVIPA